MGGDIPQMPPERWHRVVEVFGDVKDLPSAHRNSYLEVACEGDSELRRQVEDLLAEDAAAEDFLQPILAVLPPGTSATSTFDVGQMVANRYTILDVLGEGGMGSVYKAWDRALDRTVVIKVIHPRLAGSEIALKRFKRELLLARQIGHKNIVRIFDIGESDGTKFITMEYIEGVDLKKRIVKAGKFPAHQAIAIDRQICHALEAAHEEGIVHRDLKPQNIMVQNDGRVVVMDFGIAHSDEVPSMTVTGAMIGTPEYMSPEQAKGEKVDRRSDIFSLGLIFYELLTGTLPFKGQTLQETLFKRIGTRAVPPVEIEGTVPPQANRVIMRCLEPDPRKRYPTASAVLTDLGAIDPAQPATTWMHFPHGLSHVQLRWKAAAAVLVGLMGMGIYFSRDTWPRSSAGKKIVQVLIADFSIEPGVLDTPLEPVLTLALEGAPFVEVADRQRAKAVAASIKAKQMPLDEETARLVAVREGINAVISGSLVRRGQGLEVSGKAIDAVTGHVLRSARVSADGKSSLLTAMAKLGASIRSSLGDNTPESIQLAAAETFTVGSLEAMTNYAKAQELRSAGKWEDAIHYYSQAVAVDPKLGRAFAGMAAASFNLGRTGDAEKYYQFALANSDRMTDREKYRTRGGYFLTVRDYNRAIEQFKTLVEKFPADAAGRNNLAAAYFYKRDMSNALVEVQQFVSLYPKIVAARNSLALYAMYAGNFEKAKVESSGALQQIPSFAKGYLAIGLSELALGHNDEAMQAYEKMTALGSRGASLAAVGLADLKIFEGRFRDAEAILQKAIAADLENKEVASAAENLATLAFVQISLNRRTDGVASVEQALRLSTELRVLFEAARVFIQLGRPDRAEYLARELNAWLQDEPRAYARLIEGEILLSAGKIPDAIRKFAEARQYADTWLGHMDTGRAYLEAGAFAEASSEFDTSLRRRGEATAVFLDDLPTYHYFPLVLYYLGRVHEGLKGYGALEQYHAFLDIKRKSETDPLVEDAKRRVEMLSNR